MSDKKKPLLFGKESSKQDETLAKLESDRFEDPELKPWYDPSSIPGHAELQLAEDMEKAQLPEHVKEGYYKRWGQRPAPKPAELVWLRTVGPDGRRSYNADVTKMRFLRDFPGYRPATKEDLKRAGYGLPVAGEVLPDGSIRREDTQLFIVDGEKARQFEKERLERSNRPSEREASHPGDVWIAEEERRKEDPFERLRAQQS